MSITVKDFVAMILPSDAEAIMDNYFNHDGHYDKKNAKGALEALLTELYDDEYNKGYIPADEYLDYKPFISEDAQRYVEDYIAEEAAYEAEQQAQQEAQREVTIPTPKHVNIHASPFQQQIDSIKATIEKQYRRMQQLLDQDRAWREAQAEQQAQQDAYNDAYITY